MLPLFFCAVYFVQYKKINILWLLDYYLFLKYY